MHSALLHRRSVPRGFIMVSSRPQGHEDGPKIAPRRHQASSKMPRGTYQCHAQNTWNPPSTSLTPEPHVENVGRRRKLKNSTAASFSSLRKWFPSAGFERSDSTAVLAKDSVTKDQLERLTRRQRCLCNTELGLICETYFSPRLQARRAKSKDQRQSHARFSSRAKRETQCKTDWNRVV